MSLHRLTDITISVPNVAETVDYYTTFGLIPQPSDNPAENWFGTVDGGSRQLRIVRAPVRKLLSLGVGADDRDDLARIAASLQRCGVARYVEDDQLVTVEPGSGVDVTVSVAPRIRPKAAGEPHLPNHRAPALLRTEPARPRKLGHVLIGSTDAVTSQRFFTEGLGFKVSDVVRDVTFMRCSTDHHNVVIAPSPVNYLHHSSWEVQDVDEIGRGAKAVLEGHPERHTWGVGRHWVGANYFYYLRDPAGNQSEYYSDMDEIADDQLWEPGVFEVAALWGPPLPASLIEPDDLAALMASSH